MGMARLSILLLASLIAALAGSACTMQIPVPQSRLPERASARVLLDWTPNTNHIGFFVADALGFYDDMNLDVEILVPGEVDAGVIDALEQDLVEFGINYQEYTSFALADGAEIVAVAAVLQHNTTGFASYAGRNSVTRPADLADLTYYGSGAVAEAFLSRLTACDGSTWQGNYAQLGVVDMIDVLVEGEADFGWIYYGWEGIDAQLRGVALDVVRLSDHTDCIPDYYTPLIVTSAHLIETQPHLVRAFVHATARGYEVAIHYPRAAAELLLAAEPELDEALVLASTEWLAEQYQADAPRWGEQRAEVWQAFTDFLLEAELIETPIDIDAAFTNAFLPAR